MKKRRQLDKIGKRRGIWTEKLLPKAVSRAAADLVWQQKEKLENSEYVVLFYVQKIIDLSYPAFENFTIKIIKI